MKLKNIRGVLFYLWIFFITLIVLTVVIFNHLIKKKQAGLKRFWGKYCLWGASFFCNLKYQIISLEKTFPEKIIIASEHQSVFEVFAHIMLFPNSIFILKKSLTNIPFFGMILKILKMIPVDRSKYNHDWLEVAKKRFDENYSVIIFPEGTRAAVDEKVSYKKGVFKLQEFLKVPIVPIALNSGKFWPKNQFPSSGIVKIIIGNPVMQKINEEELRMIFNDLRHRN